MTTDDQTAGSGMHGGSEEPNGGTNPLVPDRALPVWLGVSSMAHHLMVEVVRI